MDDGTGFVSNSRSTRFIKSYNEQRIRESYDGLRHKEDVLLKCKWFPCVFNAVKYDKSHDMSNRLSRIQTRKASNQIKFYESFPCDLSMKLNFSVSA